MQSVEDFKEKNDRSRGWIDYQREYHAEENCGHSGISNEDQKVNQKLECLSENEKYVKYRLLMSCYISDFWVIQN